MFLSLKKETLEDSTVILSVHTLLACHTVESYFVSFSVPMRYSHFSPLLCEHGELYCLFFSTGSTMHSWDAAQFVRLSDSLWD